MSAAAPESSNGLKRSREKEEVQAAGPSGNGHAELDASDDDDDLGPMPLPADAAPRKRQRVLQHEKLYLERLPSADRYQRSFMHRDTVTHVLVTATAFLLTASTDGHLKFWKKQDQNAKDASIEFVKHYRAHLTPILALVASADGLLAATLAADGNEGGSGGSAKVFDVENFDMINMFTLPYTPRTSCWIHGPNQPMSLLAIADEATSAIYIYDGRGDGTPLHKIESLHRAPVHLISYNQVYDCVISADISGQLEYWSPVHLPLGTKSKRQLNTRQHEPFEKPAHAGIWDLKSKTDLYEFKKRKSLPTSLTISPTGAHFATTSLASDRQVRVFTFLSGKLHRVYDESLAAAQEMQQAGTAARIEDMEFGRRLAAERELEKLPLTAARERATFDESGAFLLYPTLSGIKMVNIVTNKVSKLLGKDETSRFLDLSLYQGSAAKKGLQTVAMAASSNPLLQQKAPEDPVLFCTAFKRSRFYLFSREEPESDKAVDRDVFNEKPTREEQTVASSVTQKSSDARTATGCCIHTTMGDIHFKLFPTQAPKTVENFVGHSKSGYYDGVIFHRVIAKFMLQTGDPLGDGTGGESIWGGTFEDEFSPMLKHDRPYTLSMANAGPRTNGSQFFITTVPCPWLDNKHTIFGRATSGFDTIHAIENVRIDKHDAPEVEIKIVSVDIFA